ncbi:MAG: hypothetical protein K8R68_07040, partial [Bacteroidales bacterium]|nr:hypothetical protein [Bacteroidales bacterium]
EDLFSNLIYLWIIIALIIFPIMLFVRVPYGRHVSKKWGALINNKPGWIIMELPALLTFILFFLSGNLNQSAVVWTMANVLPRSLDHHKWYKNNFENYPKGRKAVIPYLL